MKNVVSATTFARQVGDILGRVRYRGESFVIERNGTAVARLEPVEQPRGGTLAEAMRGWREAAAPEPEFADALEKVNSADHVPGNAWDS